MVRDEENGREGEERGLEINGGRWKERWKIVREGGGGGGRDTCRKEEVEKLSPFHTLMILSNHTDVATICTPVTFLLRLPLPHGRSAPPHQP